MMIQEFEKLTGVEPTIEEYDEIEKEYMEQNQDKFEFCKNWLKNDGAANLYKARVKMIESLKKELINLKKEKNAEIENLCAEKEKLEIALDKELEWKTTDGIGTNMSQEKYMDLLKEGVMTEEETKELIEKLFGFKYGRIIIVNEVAIYEVNKYRRCRTKETYYRQPAYSASDWNYIRFDVNGWQYELINGELYQYCD